MHCYGKCYSVLSKAAAMLRNGEMAAVYTTLKLVRALYIIYIQKPSQSWNSKS